MATPEEELSPAEELLALFNSTYGKPSNEARFIFRMIDKRAVADFNESKDTRCLFIWGHALLRLGRGQDALDMYAAYTPEPQPGNHVSRLMNMGYASALYLTGHHEEAYRRSRPFQTELAEMQLMEIDRYPLICLEMQDIEGMKVAIEAMRDKYAQGMKAQGALILGMSFIYVLILYYSNMGETKSLLEIILQLAQSQEGALDSEANLDKMFEVIRRKGLNAGVKDELTETEAFLLEDARELASVLVRFPYEKIFFDMSFEFQGRSYTALVFRNPDGCLSAEVREVPGCFTDGRDEQELQANLKEALICHLEVA